jgi:hypothetical protein
VRYVRLISVSSVYDLKVEELLTLLSDVQSLEEESRRVIPLFESGIVVVIEVIQDTVDCTMVPNVPNRILVRVLHWRKLEARARLILV